VRGEVYKSEFDSVEDGVGALWSLVDRRLVEETRVRRCEGARVRGCDGTRVRERGSRVQQPGKG
jgi:hypothetical protein